MGQSIQEWIKQNLWKREKKFEAIWCAQATLGYKDDIVASRIRRQQSRDCQQKAVLKKFPQIAVKHVR